LRKYLLILALLFPLVLNGQSILSGSVASITTGTASTEMISNGAFASATDWTLDANWTIGSGVATYDKLGNTALIQTDADMVSSILPNTAYTLEFDVSGTTGGGIYMSIRIAAKTIIYVNITEYNNGHKVVNFTTPADVDTGGISFLGNTAGDSGGNIDNVSLKPS